MTDEQPQLNSFPDQPLTQSHVKEIGESDAFVGAMPYPGEEDQVQGILLVKQDEFVNVVYDRRDSVWRQLTTYVRDAHEMPDVMRTAVQDRTEWMSKTGRLDELL